MYFEIDESHPDITPVGSVMSWREGVLLSIILHLIFVILLLVAPDWLAQFEIFKPAPQQVRPLYVMFENQWYEVDKEEFVIGRGQKFSDLPIKDANISRRHCSIVRRGPDYFIKDLGSTNGVEFNGERVDNHRIEEGTLYRLCDHELRFSFIPPA